MGQGSNFRRRLKVFTVALTIYLDYKVASAPFSLDSFLYWFCSSKRTVFVKVCHLNNFHLFELQTVQKKDKWIAVDKRDDLWERAHERNANRLLSAIIGLEGLWVKLGQYLSTRADVLPDAYIQLLKQLQDSLPPRPLSEVTAIELFKI
jgi:aarF domain-containing kinase